LKRCNPVEILTYPPRVPEGFTKPAAQYFAGIVEPLGLKLGDDSASDLFPVPADIDAARAFIAGLPANTRLLAIHPGSGGENKNWPVESWAELGRRLVREKPDIALLLVEGEADGEQARHLIDAWKDLPHLRARWLPLPILAALFRETVLFLGHDSGITHMAAASKRELPVVALFGPTDPVIWAPPRKGVHVLRAPSALSSLTVEQVLAVALPLL